MADDGGLADKIQNLTDLELAALICLVSREHCLISTPSDYLEDLIQELQLIASKTFALHVVVVDCNPSTTLQDFAAALLLPTTGQSRSRSTSPLQTRSDSYFFPKQRGGLPAISPLTPSSFSSSRIANVVLAKNLDLAPHAVQIQALELLRTRRIFTRTAVQTAPKQFLFVPVLAADSGGQAHVTAHLNDFLAIAHWHDPEDGFTNLEDWDSGEDDETASTGSVVKKGQRTVETTPSTALVSETEISHLAKLSREVQIDVDVTRYQMNVVSFLRMHRAVAAGISPAASKHMNQLVRCLAPLHNLDFVTPALIGVAARKVYLHRIRIVTPERERSMQWGSKADAVSLVLEGVGPEEVVEDVLETVPALL